MPIVLPLILALTVGATSPSFQAQTHDGETITDESLRGRVVVLEFIRSGAW
jgi:peroxiredoxin